MERTLTSIGIACAVGLFLLFLGRRQTTLVTDSRPRRPMRGDALPAILIDFGYWLLGAFIPLFRYLHITPNLLSFLSLPACLGAAMTIAIGHFGFGGPLLLFAFSLLRSSEHLRIDPRACDGQWVAPPRAFI